MVVCSQCAYSLVHLRVASCLDWFSSCMEMIAGVVMRTNLRHVL